MKVVQLQETAKRCVISRSNTEYEGTSDTAIPLKEISTQHTDKQDIKSNFLFLRRVPNSEYELGLKRVPLRTCLLHNNGAVNSEWVVKTKPKWFTDLARTDVDVNTGEITGQSVYRTDDLTAGNNRKIKAVNRFTGYFNPLYKARKVSMLFYTFTVANQAKLDIRDLFKVLRKRLKRNNVNLNGYLWVLEVSDNLHVHYHAIVVTDRIKCKGSKLPSFFIMDDVWGARCQVQFIRKNVRYYLATYFTKNKNRIERKRLYGLKMPKN